MGNSVHRLSGQGDGLMGEVVNLRLARKARARADIEALEELFGAHSALPAATTASPKTASVAQPTT